MYSCIFCRGQLKANLLPNEKSTATVAGFEFCCIYTLKSAQVPHWLDDLLGESCGGTEAQQLYMSLSALISVTERNAGEQGCREPHRLRQYQENQYLLLQSFSLRIYFLSPEKKFLLEVILKLYHLELCLCRLCALWVQKASNKLFIFEDATKVVACDTHKGSRNWVVFPLAAS